MNSNEPPEDSEITFIRTMMAKTEARLVHLGDEISNLRGKLERLEEERVLLLHNSRTPTDAILSPLRRMPPELIREIFLWTLPSTSDALRLGRVDTSQSPWLLTHISSRWRAISLSTSSLWSLVAIDYTASVKTTSTYSVRLVETQLQRAQKLHVMFYGSTGMNSGPQVQMFQLLSQHSSRWEQLSVGLTSELAPLLSAVRDRVPSLRILWIQWTNWEEHAGVQSIDCFQTAPCLVDVGLFNIFRFTPVLFPFHQLTRYETNCPFETHRRVLRQTPNLVEAHINIDFDEIPWPNAAPTIDLLHLRRLYISNAKALDHLRLPAVEELALPEGPDLLSSFYSLLDRSSCSIRRLCLIRPMAHTAISILQKIASITELLIVHDDDTNEVNSLVATLSVPSLPGGTTLAPHLSLLYFGCEEVYFIDYEAYLAMLKSRWEANNCSLKRAALLIIDGPKPDPVTIAGLHALRREGLDLLLLDSAEADEEMNGWEYTVSSAGI
ncbi:F-box domain-containing protein [Mycena sanguinolenta]|uniref:F-box domain-containing protein n=1 Tax=Mycena sanguinolenta TaxID=230812 RepID=A0A8H6Z4B1_9AGAR|nr:F-box domain-containing protein [Mycena sanguinolenta]